MELTELMSKANIADYISQYVQLSPGQGEELWGLSCFKAENTPSFSVNPNKGVFKDFSSGQGGNIINFIMAYRECDVREAIQILKTWLGVTDDVTYSTLPIIKELKKFKPKMKTEKDIEHRHLSHDAIEDADCSNMTAWVDEGISPDICRKYEIGIDQMSDCISIPIWDMDGTLINILHRTLNPNFLPKYIYKYKLGTVDFFWGWAQKQDDIALKRQVIIVEGVKSVLKLEQMGYPNAVAMLTSHLNPEQLKILIKFGYDCVFALDKDADPVTDGNIQQLKKYCRVYIVRDFNNQLGAKDAPCDKGAEIFADLYERRARLL